VRLEDGVEIAVRDSTYQEPCQIVRTRWLVENCRDVPVGLNGQKDIMELGCSNGHQLLACNGHIGVDLNPDITRDNWKAHPDRHWITANITNLPVLLSLPRTHTILLPDVIEHLEFGNALKVIAGCKELAKHRILITTPNGTDLSKNQRNWMVKKHQFVVTKPKLKQILDACSGDGWKITWHTDEAFVYIRMEVAK